jgi:hypothetical protein
MDAAHSERASRVAHEILAMPFWLRLPYALFFGVLGILWSGRFWFIGKEATGVFLLIVLVLEPLGSFPLFAGAALLAPRSRIVLLLVRQYPIVLRLLIGWIVLGVLAVIVAAVAFGM